MYITLVLWSQSSLLVNDEVIKVFSTSEWNVNPHIIGLELEGGHVSSLAPGFLDPSFCYHISFVFMLYLYYLLFCLWMLVLKFILYSVSYCSLREWYLNLVLDCSLREPYLNFFSDCSLCELYMYFVSSSTSRKENQ